MGALGNLGVARHLLIAGGLLLGVLAYGVAQNWDTFALMYDNLAAMNEGGQVAREMERPEDLLGYIANHPGRASLVAYDVGGAEEGMFFRADVRRPVVNTPHLLLLAAYAHGREADRLSPDQPVPLDSLDVYALPGAGQDRHERARKYWRTQGHLQPDSTVALRHVVDAIARFGDDASADWFLSVLGRDRVRTLPERWGLSDSGPPLPSSGLSLSWSHHRQDEPVSSRRERYRAMPRAAFADHVYRLTRTLRRDSRFRRNERERASRRGSGLSIRDQRALARATYPRGTAADYANFLARVVSGELGTSSVSQLVRRRIETPVESDSMRASIEALGTQAGAAPGILSFAGYVRYASDRPPRVVSLFLEDLPIGLFYHLVQTGLDKGFHLRLLSDPDFFQRVRARLSESEVATNAGDSLGESGVDRLPKSGGP
jgi:hypothetical protein